MTTILAGGLLLGVLVFVHELGHFLVAKACGVRVLVFSLGFGPRLFGFRRGDTDYRVSAIPLGGYVRMYGDDPSEEVPEEERNRSYLQKPSLQKSAIAFAGPAANFLLPVLLFFGLFVGQETTSGTLVGTVVPDEPAAEAGLQAGDRILEVDGKRIETFREVQELVEARPGQALEFVVERDGERVRAELTPRGTPSLNPIERDKELGRVGIMPHVQRPFVHVAPGSPAAEAGLETLDLVTAVNGVEVTSREHLLELLEPVEAPAPAGGEEAEGGDELTITVQKQPLEQREESEGHVQPEETEERDGVPGLPEERTVTLSRSDLEVPYSLVEDPSLYGVTEDELAKPELAALVERTRALLAEEAAASGRRFGISSYEGTLQVVAEQEPAEAPPEGLFARLRAYFADDEEAPDPPAVVFGVQPGDRAAVVDAKLVHVGSEVSSRLLGRPDDVHVVGLLDQQGKARVLAFRLTPEQERGRQDFKTFGAYPGGGTWTEGELITRQVSVVEASGRAASETGSMVSMTVKSLWMLFTGQVSLSSLGGPITIVDLAGQAAERGHETFVTLMAFISVNLGIINLLPVPVLDGGHLLMFGIEGVSRQRLSARTRENAMKIGFALLLCLVVVALFNDVLRLL